MTNKPMRTKRKNPYKAALAVTTVLMSAPLVQAGTIAFAGFTMDFVDVGNAGNTADDTGYGAVDYNYQMGKNEVSEAMIEAYNTANAGALITLNSRGANSPATSVSWNESANFVNWLNVQQGYSPAYKLSPAGGTNTNILLWSLGDAGYDASNPFRNSNAKYVLPSENEWYKAAYYDPNKSGGAGYYDYATGSDTAPTAVANGTASGTAVYNGQSGPADITNAGGISPYGTMAQNGNVSEWGESAFDESNNSAGESRVIRGGGWNNNSGSLQSSAHNFSASPTLENNGIGFRVAAVPEPSGVSLLLIGAVGLLMKRKRG